MKYFLLSFAAVLLVACGNTTNKVVSHDEYQELLKQTILKNMETLLFFLKQIALFLRQNFLQAFFLLLSSEVQLITFSTINPNLLSVLVIGNKIR